MNLRKLENENLEQYVWRLGCAKDSGEIDMNWDELADVINREIGNEDMPYTSSAFRKPYQYARKFFDSNVFGTAAQEQSSSAADVRGTYGAETSINKDGSFSSSRLVEMNEEQSKDPEYILKAHGFDPDSWKIVNARNNMRNVSSHDGVPATLYASNITVKPISDGDVPLNKIGEFFDRLDRNYSLPPIDERPCATGDKLLLIDIADLHMNLQASMFTSGNEYNCDIAEKLFFHVLGDVLVRTSHYDFEEAVFLIGGDMLNTNDLRNTTAKGTPQDNDMHYYDAYERLCAMTVKAVDVLKEKCKVNVVYVPGNHDELAGFKLAKYIDAWFRNDDTVSVDYSPLARKYRLYGNTLLCFAHDAKNVQKLPAIIANEARAYWSEAETVEVFLQHMHSEQILMEENNIRIQRLPTISGRSKWSADNGYASKRQCKSFVFDSEDGLTDVLYTPIR